MKATLGADGASRLIAAFAAFPCPYCAGGFEQCALCGGSGHGDEVSDACITCMGMGGTSCNFCGGSGLATYNMFPGEYRPAIASARSKWAIKQTDALPAKFGKSSPNESPAHARQRLAKQAGELNRALAALRNAIDMSRQVHRHNRRGTGAGTGAALRLFKRCERAAKIVQERLAETMQKLAEATDRLAESSDDPTAQEFERDRAELFRQSAKRVQWASKRRTALLLPRH
jgi:hypothetical protein